MIFISGTCAHEKFLFAVVKPRSDAWKSVFAFVFANLLGGISKLRQFLQIAICSVHRLQKIFAIAAAVP